MPLRIETKKWVLYRHTSDFNLIIIVAKLLKNSKDGSISKDKKLKLLFELREQGYFKERNNEFPLDSINHRINTLTYFMFGYKTKINGNQKFLFSPLGNLFLRNLEDKTSISKIFLTQLWGFQFNHPIIKGTHESFKLYPFRLIFKMLCDDRLRYCLYAFEVALAVVFIKKINEVSYELIVNRILEIRSWSNKRIRDSFLKDEHVHVNALYEWDYYLCRIFSDAGLIQKEIGPEICRLRHGSDTTRILKRNKVTLEESIITYCKILLNKYPYHANPVQLNEKSRLQLDIIKEIYNFYPDELLTEINAKGEDQKRAILDIPKLIKKYSLNERGETWESFEKALTNGLNMFYNVEAIWVGGPGNTDIECLYISKNEKFAVDAKSTKNKLTSLNRGRLKRHREKIGGKYTIVITPRYTPVVKDDIRSSRVVIILASTFSEYLYNCIDNGIRKIDYEDFHWIILQNLGKDVSPIISDMTINKFAYNNVTN